MNYYVSRGGQQYGPYSLADLQRYVAQGNIVLTDLACGEGGTQWVPVSQIIGPAAAQPQPATGPAQPAPQSYGQAAAYSQPQRPAPPQSAVAGPYSQLQGGAPSQSAVASTGPLPPGLQWPIVLLLAIVTCGLFTTVWIFIQASFVKQIRPASNAILLYAIGIGAFFAAGFMMPFALRGTGVMPLGWLLYMAGFVLVIMGHFNMKSSLEEYYNTVEPINLRLSGVMTFFFNVLYFQYHLTRIREWKTTGVWR